LKTSSWPSPTARTPPWALRDDPRLSVKDHPVKFRPLVLALALVTTASAGGAAEAHGCIKGAVVGGVAGHFAHHHALAGAAVGCLVGHHMAHEKAKREAAAAANAQPHR